MKAKGVKRDKSAKSPAEMMLHKIQGMVDAFNAMYGSDGKCRLDLMTKEDHYMEQIKIYNYSQQYNLDIATIALHEEWGFAEERQNKFHKRFDKVYEEYKDLHYADYGGEAYEAYKKSKQEDYVDDGRRYIGDPEMLGTIESLEKKVKAACGKYYSERDKRYSLHVFRGNKEVGQVCFADEIKGRLI